jgi:hypothetical protein
MSPSTSRDNAAYARSGRRKRYDKDLVRERTLELLSVRLGPPKEQGARAVWDCPACGKREKYSVVKSSGKGGCLVADCRLAGSGDVFVMLAGLEDLDYKADFLALLARSYDLLGLEPDSGNSGNIGRPKSPDRARNSGSASDRRKPDAAAHRTDHKERAGKDGAVSSADAPRVVPVTVRDRRREDSPGTSPAENGREAHRSPDELLNVAARAYERILEICPLETRDRAYLKKRGLSNATIRRGRFGTMTAPRASKVKAVLQRELGREALLSVPGFSEDEGTGRLKFTLTGNYILIPYHDARGRITTVEGRVVGKVKDRKYVTLRRAGNHLYVFPGYRPEEILAVCEGAMGAIVAAECGLAVGAIMGCERFRASPSPEMLDGNAGDPLLELGGVDFGGRRVPYIPDADDPPNPNVLRAAPKAARWVAEPQNGKAAVCVLPKGADLDEWLLSLDPDERAARFAELLAGANPPEDDRPLAGPGAVLGGTDLPAPGPTGHDRGGHASEASRSGASQHDGADSRTVYGPVPTEGDLREGRAGAKSAEKASSRKRSDKRRDGDDAQPGLWDGADEASKPAKRGVSRGARKLRDEVYRALIEKLPPKDEHLAALEKLGVMRATARVGRFASLTPEAAGKAVSELGERFGAKRLLTVPGFEADEGGKFSLALAQGRSEQYVLIPCFDADGLLAGVEGMPFDHKGGELNAEETVPLKGAGSHLYVFAHYPAGQLEGFCEGPLGAMLAAQEDVVVGAIGGFRRHRAASGPGEGRQAQDAVLPELEGVDLAGRRTAYVPRSGVGEANARYHEAPKAVRWLAEHQGGDPTVVSLSGGEDRPEGDESENGRRTPTSLGEWVRTLPEEEVHDRLRELFPESPARQAGEEEASEPVEGADATGTKAAEGAPPLPTRAVLACAAIAATVGLALGAALLRLRDFAGYVSTTPAGEPVLYSGPLGPLRRLADASPFRLLYDHYLLIVLAAIVGLALFLILKARARHLDRWRASRFRLRDRWELHEVPMASGPTSSPTAAVLTREEVLWGLLAWPLGYFLVGWVIAALEGILALAASLGVVPDVGPLVASPTTAAVYAAFAISAFVLWQRRSIRAAEARMLSGKIRH